MAAQTEYRNNLEVALPGLIYDMGNTDIDSFAAEGVVPYGRAVVRGTNPTGQVTIAADGSVAIGFSVRATKENLYQSSGVVPGYEDKETVGVMRSGYIWAEFSAAGGIVGDSYGVDAEGRVVPGGGTPTVKIHGHVERPAVAMNINGVDVFVGLISIGMD